MAMRAPRLAGISVLPEQRRRTLADVLPRMDIAAFVGFAAIGPLHEPVAVEDTQQFAATFGDDVAMAWDAERGETAYGYLAPAVRTFFRNGGRRCWVVRVPRPSGDVGTLRGLALFAGFAARGPVQRPVLLTTTGPRQLQEVFGDTPPAWLLEREVPAAVALATAVQAFFAGGGTNCLALRLPDLGAGNTIPLRAGLFLDPDLAETGVEALQAQADYLRYQSPEPRALLGIHALMEIEEVTLIAAPDAHSRGWQIYAAEPTLPEQPVVVKPPAVSCEPAGPPDEPGQFAPCVVPVEPVVLSEPAVASRPRAAMLPPMVLGDQSWLVLLDVQRALLRMCAARGDVMAILSVPTSLGTTDARDHALALNLKPAGRAAPLVLQDARALCSGGAAEQAPVESARTRSFAALYHPWLVGCDELDNRIRQTPPDGVACGLIARRALARGAWVAPANEALVGIVALAESRAPTGNVVSSPPVWFSPPELPLLHPDGNLILQEAGINVIRQTPRGFVPISANTMAVVRCRPEDELRDQQLDDTELRPINVRRLLMLLRRLALLVGATYVFEPNGPAFRRQVQRGFETLLEGLYLRGAFAGANAASAFQVDIGPTLNTQATIDHGQLIVELRVAPARPLTFLTLRLVRSGEQSLLVQEL